MIGPDALAVYVVNLPRRSDRREWIHQRLRDELATIYTSDFDDTFDGHLLRDIDLRAAGIELFDWPIASDNPWWNRPLKYGEIGCTLAHLACWNHAAGHSRASYVLVLEDDAEPTADFLDRLLTGLNQLQRRAVRFDLLYLGRYRLEPDDPAPVPGFVRPGYSHCTYGYLLTRRALDILRAACLERAIIPIDEFLPAMYIPHPREDLRARFPPRLDALAFEPPLVTQRSKDVAGSDTEDSEFFTPAVDSEVSTTSRAARRAAGPTTG